MMNDRNEEIIFCNAKTTNSEILINTMCHVTTSIQEIFLQVIYFGLFIRVS